MLTENLNIQATIWHVQQVDHYVRDVFRDPGDVGVDVLSSYESFAQQKR